MASIVSHAQDKDISAVPSLIVALNDENAVVRREAVEDLRTLMYDTPPNHKKFKKIARALVKAFKDDDYEVRYSAMIHFFGMGDSVKELPPELATEVISGLVQSLYYGSPFFCGFYIDVGTILHRWGDCGLAAVTEALHSSSWSLRFGAAVTYGNAYRNMHIRLGMLQHHYIKPLPKAVVPILAEGLTHPDWRTQEDAARVLDGLDIRHCHLCDHTDEARQALEALPPFGIISQSIRDGDDVVNTIVMDKDSKCLDSLNADGITFKFNRSIRRSGTLTIRPFTEAHDCENRWKRVYGEPLGWNIARGSHSMTITPQMAKNW